MSDSKHTIILFASNRQSQDRRKLEGKRKKIQYNTKYNALGV